MSTSAERTTYGLMLTLAELEEVRRGLSTLEWAPGVHPGTLPGSTAEAHQGASAKVRDVLAFARKDQDR